MLKLMFKLLLTFILAVFFNSSAIAGDSITFKWVKNQETDQHQLNHKHKKAGPPTHAPGHGYRAKHQYRYYPSQKVYQDTDRSLYFYLKGDNWEVGVTLPSHVRSELAESVNIELYTDKPYVHNAEHIKKYPPENSRKTKKNLLAKLIYVLLYEYAP